MAPLVNIVSLLLYARALPNADGGSLANKTATDKTVMASIGHSQTDAGGAFVPLMNMSLGSPPQGFTTIFDTGSSDLIVPDSKSSYCKQPTADCAPLEKGGNGAFSPEQSKEVTEVKTVLDTGFANGETELGKFVKAEGTVGEAKVPDFQFGLIDEGKPSDERAPLIPVLGVGPITAETNSTPTYPNLPARMKDKGVISANVYGVYTNDFRGNDGSVTFGGIDKAKFTGELKEAPMVPTPPDIEDDNKESNRNKGNSGKNEKNGSNGKNGKNSQNGNDGQKGNNNKGGNSGNNRRYLRHGPKRVRSQGIRVFKRDSNNNTAEVATEFIVQFSSVSYVPAKAKRRNNGNGNGNGNGKQKGNRNGNSEDEGDPGRDGQIKDLTPKEGLAPALIDTGNPENNVPASVLKGLANALGAGFDNDIGFIEPFDCSKTHGSLRFGFNNDTAMIDVPLELMLIPQSITREKTCDLAMTASNFISLGSPFLQSAYTVFDEENKRLMFAQAVINTTRSDVQAVGIDWRGTITGTG